MKWMCGPCGYIYDEEEGYAPDGIEPGTPFHTLPDGWVCPDCGLGQDEFFEIPE